jgi:hypothetical protein
MNGPGVKAFAEITSIVRRTCEGILTGDYRGAASAFVNYWNGHGAWLAPRTVRSFSWFDLTEIK